MKQTDARQALKDYQEKVAGRGLDASTIATQTLRRLGIDSQTERRLIRNGVLVPLIGKYKIGV